MSPIATGQLSSALVHWRPACWSPTPRCSLSLSRSHQSQHCQHAARPHKHQHQRRGKSESSLWRTILLSSPRLLWLRILYSCSQTHQCWTAILKNLAALRPKTADDSHHSRCQVSHFSYSGASIQATKSIFMATTFVSRLQSLNLIFCCNNCVHSVWQPTRVRVVLRLA